MRRLGWWCGRTLCFRLIAVPRRSAVSLALVHRSGRTRWPRLALTRYGAVGGAKRDIEQMIATRDCRPARAQAGLEIFCDISGGPRWQRMCSPATS